MLVALASALPSPRVLGVDHAPAAIFVKPM